MADAGRSAGSGAGASGGNLAPLQSSLSQAEQIFLVGKAWRLWRKGGSATRLLLPKECLTMAQIPFIV